MNIHRFSFKNEAVWMMIFSLALPLIAVLALVIVLFLHWMCNA
jgi:hypothetical protein